MCFNVKFAWFSLGNVSFFRISTHELQDVSISFLTTMWTVFRRCILGFFKHSDYCMIAVFVHHSICMLDIFQGIASFYSAIDLMQHKIAFSFSLYGGFFSILIFKNKFPFSQTYTYFHVIRRLRSKLLNRIGRVLSKPKWK